MAEEEKEEKKSNKLLPIIIGAVGGIILLLAGLALGFFLFSSPAADPSAEVDEIIEKNTENEEEIEEDDNSTPDKIALDTPENQVFLTTYYEFPGNFTTNLKGSKKFLQLSLGVSTQYDEQVMANVDSHQLALRSEILTIMSTFSAEDIAGREGKQKLADALKEGINEVLVKVEGFGGVENVHFTSFVLQ